MGDNMRKIEEYTQVWSDLIKKDFYQVEEKIESRAEQFQLDGFAMEDFFPVWRSKRLVEITKLYLGGAPDWRADQPYGLRCETAVFRLDEFSHIAMLIITHDRDVLGKLDRIVEIKGSGQAVIPWKLRRCIWRESQATTAGMNNFEQIEKRIVNLSKSFWDYQAA